MKKKSVLTIFIMIALLATSLSFMFVPTSSNIGSDARPALTLPTLTSQSVLHVDSDADFPLNGFTGTGTASDPYLLYAKDVDATGSYNSIYIGNTTAFFIIRSCSLHNASTPLVDPAAYLPYHAGSGITLNNVTNGKIENSKIDQNDRGVVLIGSSITIANDTFSNNTVHGIEIIASTGFIVNNNTISNSTYGVTVRGTSNLLSQGQIDLNWIRNSGKDGMSLTNLHGGYIGSNEIDSSHFNGTTLINSDNNTVENNTFYQSGTNGLALTNASNTNIVHHNFFSINSAQGALLSGSRLNQLYDNQFINNTDVGIRVLSGGTNWVYRNYLSGNNNSFLTTNPQAYSATLTNWNMTNGGVGNAWHNWISPDANYDGIVDIPYVIPGLLQNDSRPLTGMVTPPSGLTATRGWRAELERTELHSVLGHQQLPGLSQRQRDTDRLCHWFNVELHRWLPAGEPELHLFGHRIEHE
jgi:parallel beta-helix repeat protein